MRCDLLRMKGLAEKRTSILCARQMLMAFAACVLLAPSALGDDTESQDGSDVELRQLEQILHENRAQRIRLKRARELFESDRLTEGLQYVQRLLDDAQDGFLLEDEQAGVMTIRREAHGVLAGLNPAERNQYEQLYGTEAERLLKRAEETDDVLLLAEVTQRFYFTRAGFEAADRIASWRLRRGEYAAAARLWSELLNTPAHANRITPTLLAKTVFAMRRSGQGDLESNWSKTFARQRFRTHGREMTGSDWLNAQPEVVFAPQLSETPLPQGAPDRNASFQATPPFVDSLWRVSYFSTDHELLRSRLQNWRNLRKSDGHPVAVANTAIAVDGLIIVRDFNSVTALDPTTGDERWRYRSGTSLIRASEDVDRINRYSSVDRYRIPFELNLDAAFAGNSTMGMMTSDTERLYFVDDVELKRPSIASNGFLRRRRRRSYDPPRDWNRLVAIDFDSEPSADQTMPSLWTIGGPTDARNAKNPLAGHFFLGPPLPAGGLLYVAAEYQSIVYLMALSQTDGRLIWSIPVSRSERSIDFDRARHPLACIPAWSAGVVVFPTNLGALIGVDGLTGAILWSKYVGPEIHSDDPISQVNLTRTTRGSTSFSSIPIIHRRSVVVLPRFADRVYCFDLETGAVLWRTARDDLDEYLAAVSDDVALIVGRGFCRGISLSTGEETWRRPFGMPAGRGVKIGTKYLLPVRYGSAQQHGRIVQFEIDTGEESLVIPYPQIAADHGSETQDSIDLNDDLGNLVVSGDVMVSCGVTGIVAYRHADAELERMKELLTQDSPPYEAVLKAAHLETLLGDMTAARTRINELLPNLHQPSQRETAESMLRELLYLEIAKSTVTEAELLERLESISRTPEDRARFLVFQAESQLRQGAWDAWIDTIRQLTELDWEKPLPIGDDPNHFISIASWISSLPDQLDEPGLAAANKKLRDHADSIAEQLLENGQPAELERFLAFFPDSPQADAVQLRLARQLIERGDLLQAELLLLPIRHRRNWTQVATALRLLAEIWSRLGLHAEAIAALDQLSKRWAAVTFDEKMTDKEFAEKLRQRTPIGAYEKSRRTWSVEARNAVVTQRFQYDPLNRLNDRFRELVTSTEPMGPAEQRQLTKALWKFRDDGLLGLPHSLQLLEGGYPQAPNVVLLDRATGIATESRSFSSLLNWPTEPASDPLCHFLPVSSEGRVEGLAAWAISEKDRLWSHDLTDGESETIAELGPFGTGFCVYRTRDRIVVVDPATGRVKWERRGLETSLGVLDDSRRTIFDRIRVMLFGDEKVLVVLMRGPSMLDYTVFRTSDGHELHRGRHRLTSAERIWTFGRHLAFVYEDGHNEFIRVWDPLTDETLFQRELAHPKGATKTSDGQLAVIVPGPRIQVFDVTRRAVELDGALSDGDLDDLTGLEMFRDARRFFVHFDRESGGRSFRFLPPDFRVASLIPMIHLRGELHVFDAETNQRLWKRPLSERSIVDESADHLPFLIAVRRVFDRNSDELAVEVIDKNSGEVISRGDELITDQLIFFSLEPDEGRVTLHGNRSQIRIELDKPLREPVNDWPF